MPNMKQHDKNALIQTCLEDLRVNHHIHVSQAVVLNILKNHDYDFLELSNGENKQHFYSIIAERIVEEIRNLANTSQISEYAGEKCQPREYINQLLSQYNLSDSQERSDAQLIANSMAPQHEILRASRKYIRWDQRFLQEWQSFKSLDEERKEEKRIHFQKQLDDVQEQVGVILSCKQLYTTEKSKQQREFIVKQLRQLLITQPYQKEENKLVKNVVDVYLLQCGSDSSETQQYKKDTDNIEPCVNTIESQEQDRPNSNRKDFEQDKSNLINSQDFDYNQANCSSVKQQQNLCGMQVSLGSSLQQQTEVSENSSLSEGDSQDNEPNLLQTENQYKQVQYGEPTIFSAIKDIKDSQQVIGNLVKRGGVAHQLQTQQSQQQYVHTKDDITLKIQRRAFELLEKINQGQNSSQDQQINQRQDYHKLKRAQQQQLRDEWSLQSAPKVQPVKCIAQKSQESDDLKLVEVSAVFRGKGAGTTKKFQAALIDRQHRLPPQISYVYLTRNEIAKDEGKIMFQVDTDGELVPVVDDPTKQISPICCGQDYLNKVQVVRSILQEYGFNEQVQKGLSRGLECTAQQILDIVSGLEQQEGKQFQLQYDEDDYFSLQTQQEVQNMLECDQKYICRRCLISGCATHAREFVKHRNISGACKLADAKEACGPLCFMNALQLIQQLQLENGKSMPVPKTPADTIQCSGLNGKRKQDSHMNGFTHHVKRMRIGNQHDIVDQNITQFDDQLSKTAETCIRNGGSQYAESTPDLDGQNDSELLIRMQQLQQELIKDWSAHELSILDQIYASGEQDLTCCMISEIIGTRSCYEVYLKTLNWSQITSLETQKASNPNNNSNRPTSGKKRRLPSNQPCLKHREKNSGRGKLDAYQPCNCGDQCDENTCPCVLTGNFCEKYCACKKGCCKNQWPGCDCRGPCSTKACRCFAADRECDPDLCVRCCVPKQEVCDSGSSNQKEPCQNMKLRLGQHKHVVIGLSQVQGWGAFINENVKKNDFIGEYTGDIIKGSEADRRGQVYDEMNQSYLFDLNNSAVLDAFFRGNKLRFANHSSKPNCKCRNIMVSGDNRLGIFAATNMKPGEELLYDYQYNHAVAPNWAVTDKANNVESPDSNQSKLKKKKKQQRYYKHDRWQSYDPAKWDSAGNKR